MKEPIIDLDYKIFYLQQEIDYVPYIVDLKIQMFNFL
uniref:Uncharacterized protein n=1 Tax=viral metagenome TaxID=1070528 RepID=A0A6C0CXU0_9ZZZZ